MNAPLLLQTTVVLINLFKFLSCKEYHIPGKEILGKLPAIYKTDYTRCTNGTYGTYCIAHVNLEPIGTPPPYWSLVEERKKSRSHYDRTSVERGLCVPSFVKSTSIEHAANEILKEEFIHYNLSHTISSLECKKEFSADMTKTLNIYKYCGIFYLFFVFLSSIYDVLLKKRRAKSLNVIEKWLVFFSIPSNWDKLVNHKKTNPDYEKLEFFQGVRFFNMNLVLLCHNKLVWTMVFLKNTQVVEDVFNNKLYLLPVSLDFFVVQTFFLISSWLLTNQILEIHKKNGEFTLNDGLIILFNRVMRYLPTLAILSVIMIGPMPSDCQGTLMFGFLGDIQEGCFKNWWMTLLQINNFAGGINKICNMGTWYLSIDTQYYLATILVLYFMLKKKQNPKICLTCFMVVAVITHTLIMYGQNLRSIQWLNLESLKRHKFLEDPAMVSQYFSFSSSWGTSVIGTCLGMVYFYSKNCKNVQPYEKVLYPLASSALPCLAILLSVFPLDPGIFASCVGALIKPIWSLGVGLGFLGITRNAMPGIFNFPKTLYQNKLAVLLGNFSYATYLIHFQIVFMKGLNDVLEANVYTATNNLLIDFFSSWTAGIIFAILVEQPGINILKEFLPQVKKRIVQENYSLRNGNNNEIIYKNKNYKNK